MVNFFSLLTDAPAGDGGGSGWFFIVYLAALFGLMYFFMIRPQRKKQKETQKMRNALQVGDTVVTIGGFYGKIVDDINDVLIIEFGTNKSVRIPVKKEAVSGIEEPDLKLKREETTEDSK